MKIHIEETIVGTHLELRGRAIGEGGLLGEATVVRVDLSTPLTYVCDDQGTLLLEDMRVKVARVAIADSLRSLV